jgi:hypothetical protein
MRMNQWVAPSEDLHIFTSLGTQKGHYPDLRVSSFYIVVLGDHD